MFSAEAVTSHSGRTSSFFYFSFQTYDSVPPNHSITFEVKDILEILPGLLKTTLHFFSIIFEGSGFFFLWSSHLLTLTTEAAPRLGANHRAVSSLIQFPFVRAKRKMEIAFSVMCTVCSWNHQSPSEILPSLSISQLQTLFSGDEQQRKVSFFFLFKKINNQHYWWKKCLTGKSAPWLWLYFHHPSLHFNLSDLVFSCNSSLYKGAWGRVKQDKDGSCFCTLTALTHGSSAKMAA